MAVTTGRYACERCGKRLPATKLLFSRHTRRRYCRDFASCDRRAKRNGVAA